MVYAKKFIVVIKVNGKILREQGDKVFIPFGSEYSVLLKNLSSVKAVASVSIDGTDVMDGHRVIVPARAEVELEGFTKDRSVSNKFKFIEKTEEISNFRGNKICDGLVNVTFNFEKEVVYRTPINFPNTFPWQQVGVWNTSSIISYGNGGLVKSGGTGGSSNQCSFSSAVKTARASSIISNESNTPKNDSGITVKGSASDQEFSLGYVNVLENEIHCIVLQLKGKTKKSNVEKAVTVKTKVLCETCGKKNKSSNKFCVNCGTALF